MEQSTPAIPAESDTSRPTSEIPEPRVKLVLRVPKQDCAHEKAVEQHKNRFYCMECGHEYRMVRQSALRRKTMLKW